MAINAPRPFRAQAFGGQLDPAGALFAPIQQALASRREEQRFQQLQSTEKNRFAAQLGLQERGLGIQEEGLDFKRQESLARINAESIKSAQAHESTLGKQLVEFMTNSEGLPGQFVMESVKGLQRPFVEAVKRRGGTQEEAQALFEQHVAIGRAKSVTDGTPFTLGEGETRFGPDGQPIASVAPQPDKPPAPTHGEQLESVISAMKQNGFSPEEIAQKIGASPNRGSFRPKAVNLRTPDGGQATGRELPDGTLEILNPDGSYSPAPPGTQMMSLQGTPADLTDEVMMRKATTMAATANNFIRIATDTVNLLQSPSVVLGKAGGMVNFLQGMRAEAKQLSDAFGDEDDHFLAETGAPITAERLLNDQSLYDFSNDNMLAVASASSRVRANVIAMGYMLARARDPNARLSDFDVQQAMETLGFGTNDKDQIARILVDRMHEVAGNYESLLSEITGDSVEFDISIPTSEGAAAVASEAPAMPGFKPGEVISLEDFERLTNPLTP